MSFQFDLYSHIAIYYLGVKLLELIFRTVKERNLFCFLSSHASAFQVQKNPLGYIYACRLYAAWENVCLCCGAANFIKVWRITPGLTCSQTCEVILSVNSQGTKVPLGIPVSAHGALRVHLECCELYMPK